MLQELLSSDSARASLQSFLVGIRIHIPDIDAEADDLRTQIDHRAPKPDAQHFLLLGRSSGEQINREMDEAVMLSRDQVIAGSSEREP